MLLLELMFVAWTTANPGEFPTLGSAANAVAEDRDTEAAMARLLGAGKKGLWAVADTAKASQGERRARLFEAMGHWKGSDAEWALLMELKKADPQTKAGVLRGLAHLRAPKNYRHIVAGAESPDAVVRDAAVESFVEIGLSEKDLNGLLQNPKPTAREAALKYLVRAGRGDLVDRAIGPALRDPAPEVQLQGIALAGKKGDGTYTRDLIRLATGPDVRVAAAAVDGLAEMRRDSTYDLAAIAADDRATEAGWKKAAETLKTQGGRSLAALVEASEKASETRARQLAAIVTRDISPEQMLGLVDMAGDRSVHRAKVGRALLEQAGEVGREAAYLRLLTSKGKLRSALVGYLRESWPEQAGKRLAERAKSGELGDRVVALELIAQLGHQPSLIAVQELIGDKAPEVRAAAVTVVSMIDDPSVVSALAALSKEFDARVRIAALRGLGRWVPQDDAAMIAAREALVDPVPAVREAAIGALSQPRDLQVLNALKDRLREAPQKERAAIAAALGKSTLQEAMVLLVSLAADKNPEVQRNAIEALRQ